MNVNTRASVGKTSDNYSTGVAAFDVEAVSAFRDNYIWLLHRGDWAVVVDPGDAAPVEFALKRRGLQLAAIFITHHHADHQGGVAELLNRWRPAIYGPGAESITGLTHRLHGGELLRIEVLDVDFEVLAVPGHTRGHIAYRCGRRLFCGDTLFGAGCGRLFEGTPEQMANSLALIAALPDDTEIYCAHEYTVMNLGFAQAVEPENVAISERMAASLAMREQGLSTVPMTLVLEKATNPFLRCHEPFVVAAARGRGACSDDPVEVFAAIRAWRNEF